MALLLQGHAHLLRRAGAEKAPLVHDRHRGGQGERLLQPVLRQDDGGAQLPVDLPEGGQKIAGGDRVQLAGGFVQNQNRGLHGHDGGQIQKLLLPAGQLRHIFIKPGLNTEKAGHLRHSAADGGGVAPKAFQPEGQLVPHLVGDDLVVRGLLHEADLLALGALVQFIQRSTLEQNFPRARPVGGEDGFQLPQQGAFSATGRAAQDEKFPRLHRQVKLPERLLLLLRVGEAQVPDRKSFHFLSSQRFRITGVRHNAR